jgi:ADP-heptose:LPS heptosyltransferase
MNSPKGIIAKLRSARTKTANMFVFIISRIMLAILFLKKRKTRAKTLFLVRLDSIGDYIFLRNYFEALRGGKKYSGYEITLCGNILWRDLSETFDKNIFDKFIWIDRKKFHSDITYRYQILKKVSEYGYESAVDLTYSREILFGDLLVYATRAGEKIGSAGALDSYVTWKRKLFSNNFYTRLIPADEHNLFESIRNREFFERLTGEELTSVKLQIDASSIAPVENVSGSYIVIVPGAGDVKRRWSAENFARVINKTAEKFSIQFYICGTEDESQIADRIIIAAENTKVKNLCGKINLSQLVKVVQGARLVISNETGTVHIAAAAGVTFVCISNGNHYGRFHPYPSEVFDKGIFVYPPEITARMRDEEFLKAEYRFGSDLSIDSILIEDVADAALKQLSAPLLRE